MFRECSFSFRKWVSKDGIVFVCMSGESAFALFVYVCIRVKLIRLCYEIRAKLIRYISTHVLSPPSPQGGRLEHQPSPACARVACRAMDKAPKLELYSPPVM